MERKKMNRISGALLLFGLTSALVIFLTAQPEEDDPLLGNPYDSKKYQREMQMLGGKGNVLASEFNDWFAGLWHGRELAGTVAVLTLGSVGVFRFVAGHPGMPPTPPEEPNQPPAEK